jgi:hypothetical protein
MQGVTREAFELLTAITAMNTLGIFALALWVLLSRRR